MMVESEACHVGCGNRLPLDDVDRTEPRLCEQCWWREQVSAWRAGQPIHHLARTSIEGHAAALSNTDTDPLRSKQR